MLERSEVLSLKIKVKLKSKSKVRLSEMRSVSSYRKITRMVVGVKSSQGGDNAIE